MAYSNKVIDHYENPRNVGSLPKDDANVGTGLVGAPECGDVMKLQVKVNPDTGVIDDAKFKTFGCGSAIASSSLATEWLKGKTVDQALAIKNTDIVAELSLPPVKIHCSVLAEDAIKAAIADYKKKQEEASARRRRARPAAQPRPRSPRGARPMIQITRRRREDPSLMAKQGITEGGLRVGVKGGGCSGLSYTFAWERKPRLGDEVFEGHGAKIFVDGRASCS
jgi:nitrogen fixation protein NifU and related proteins